MNKIIIILVIIAVLVVAAFALRTEPPQDLPQAGVTDTNTSTNAAATSTPAAGATTATAPNTATSTPVATSWKFNFTGYGPGKEHLGTFTSFAPEIVYKDGIIVSGKVVFDAKTVSTGIAGLDKHLCSDDFFDCVKYPTATFTLNTLTTTASPANSSMAAKTDFLAAGTLDFHGVSKAITFPVKRAADGTYSADFRLDTTPFNFKYVGINKEVRIELSGK